MLKACPVFGKKKSADICNAFVSGSSSRADGYVFYGVDETNRKQWLFARAEGIDWYYIDNSYFDFCRGFQYRVTKNAIQHSGTGETNGFRFAQLEHSIEPWRVDGEHIIICPQSESFMRNVIGYHSDWLNETIRILRTFTTREIRIRDWNSNKDALSKSLTEDLKGAWALVTYSSAAAISAMMKGIPAISSSGAAAIMGCDLTTICDPKMYDDRLRFFGVLADNQWSLEEMKMGAAWSELNA